MNYDKLKVNFEKHGFTTSYFKSKEEAVSYLAASVKGEVVGMGGSVTIQDMGLDQVLSKENEVIWHWYEPGRETLNKARQASVYLSSANGISETGEIVNIDGTGNRVSMTIFGPKKTIFLVGANKITPDLDSAIKRAKNVSAPKNAMRLKKNTPCAVNEGDHCYDCSSPDRICKATVILERPCNGMEVEIIFIDEELGY